MRAAVINPDGVVDNVIELDDRDPDPVPVFVDGVQQFEDVQVGVDEDGAPIIEARPVMAPGQPYTPPDGYTLQPLDDASPVGPGWVRDGDTWHDPTPAPAPVVDEAAAVDDRVDRLAAVLRAAGILTDQQIAEILR